MPSPKKFPCSPIAVLQRPLILVKREEEARTFYIMTKHSYKVLNNIGLDPRSTAPLVSVWDTGVGSPRIQKGVLPKSVWSQIHSIQPKNAISDENKRIVNISRDLNRNKQSYVESTAQRGRRGAYRQEGEKERIIY